MSVVATLGVIKKYFQGKSRADISTSILKLHRYHIYYLGFKQIFCVFKVDSYIFGSLLNTYYI